MYCVFFAIPASPPLDVFWYRLCQARFVDPVCCFGLVLFRGNADMVYYSSIVSSLSDTIRAGYID